MNVSPILGKNCPVSRQELALLHGVKSDLLMCCIEKGSNAKPGISGVGRAPRDERCGPLARPAGQSEREAKRKALRAPRANRLRLRPYQPEAPDLV